MFEAGHLDRFEVPRSLTTPSDCSCDELYNAHEPGALGRPSTCSMGTKLDTRRTGHPEHGQPRRSRQRPPSHRKCRCSSTERQQLAPGGTVGSIAGQWLLGRQSIGHRVDLKVARVRMQDSGRRRLFAGQRGLAVPARLQGRSPQRPFRRPGERGPAVLQEQPALRDQRSEEPRCRACLG